MVEKQDKPGKGPEDDDIEVIVATPGGVFRGTFRKTAKVQDVIDAAVKDRHLAAGDTFELIYGEIKLEPTTRTLVSFGLRGKVKLTLVATGSGV